MARKITTFFLLALIFGGAILQHIYVTGATEQLKNDLDQVYVALKSEDYEKAITASQTFTESWEKEKSLYESLFKHEEIDLISAGAARISDLCAQRDKAEALAETAETLYYINHIHEIDSVKLENIL